MVHVAVIGGGCAGLAAAASLAEQRIPVTLFESSPQLGGRARGIQWKEQSLDNGQHILLGAYRETLGLLRLAGVSESEALQRLPLQLTMEPDFELRACNALPAPLHILAGLIQAKGLTWHDRWSAVRFMSWIKFVNFKLKQDVALGSLLNTHSQSLKLTRMLWEPLCLAALNTPLASASAQVFINVLRDSFSKAKSDSDMLLPKLDLTQLMAEPLACFIRNNGGYIRTGISVDDIQSQNQQFSVATADGNITSFSHAIIAVSPFRLPALAKSLPRLETAAEQCKAMQYQPICTIYLQYAEHVKLPRPMTGLTDSLGQWAFDRGLLYGQHGLIAVVISAEGEHQELSQQALIRRITEELGIAFPALGTLLSQPSWNKVITEKRATFACSVDLERPQMITDIPNLYLAGDYIAGDYPATIEGAVRSGVNAATAIIQSI